MNGSGRHAHVSRMISRCCFMRYVLWCEVCDPSTPRRASPPIHCRHRESCQDNVDKCYDFVCLEFTENSGTFAAGHSFIDDENCKRCTSATRPALKESAIPNVGEAASRLKKSLEFTETGEDVKDVGEAPEPPTTTTKKKGR